MTCICAQLPTLVGGIIDRDLDVVIIIRGDHSTAFDVDWSLAIDAWPTEQIEERFSILFAIRLPKRCRGQLYPPLSLVNVYPLVFACLSDNDPELKADLAYVTEFEDHPRYGSAHLVAAGRPRPIRPRGNHGDKSHG